MLLGTTGWFLSPLPPLAKRNKTSGMGDRPTSHTVTVAPCSGGCCQRNPGCLYHCCFLAACWPLAQFCSNCAYQPQFPGWFLGSVKGSTAGLLPAATQFAGRGLCPPLEERDDKIHLVGATERCPQQDLESSASLVLQYFQVFFLLHVASGDAFQAVTC